MKNSKFQPLLIVLFAALTFASCSNDDDPKVTVYPQENPLEGFLTASNFDEVETENSTVTAQEFGFKFRPTVTGVITAITARVPDVNSDLRVTIWDVATGTVVKTETFDISSSGTAVTKQITPLALTKDKEYMISMNGTESFKHSRANNSDATYPYTVGNIQINGFGYSLADTMPNTFPINYFNGDLSFAFQRMQ